MIPWIIVLGAAPIGLLIGIFLGVNLKELDAKWWRLKYRVRYWYNMKERE